MDICKQRNRAAGIDDAVVRPASLQQLVPGCIRDVYSPMRAQLFRDIKTTLIDIRHRDISTKCPRRLSRKLADRPRAGHPYILCRSDMGAPYMPHPNSGDAKQGTELVLNIIRKLEAEVG